ncbi:MAG: hypothetical protein AB8B80_16160 [Marinicellaceae bacterium]
MKIQTVLLLMLLPNYILACGGAIEPTIALEPTHSVDPVFRGPQDAGTKGKAKALLNIDDAGVVQHLELVSIEPEKLDKEPIIKALKKTKFTKGNAVKDYIYFMEFHISDASF